MPNNQNTPSIDATDIKIINILSDNARASASAIATEIGMSALREAANKSQTPLAYRIVCD